VALFKVHCITRINQTSTFFKQLEDLFIEVCGFPNSGFDDATVYWWSDRPVHQVMNEPLIWLLESRADSLVRKVLKVTPPANAAGFTAWNSQLGGTISELYLDHPANGSGVSQAKMAFHELMHNKLQVGSALLHGSDYGLGLNREILDFKTAFAANLDSENIKRMAKVLGTAVPQWVPPFH
jgi:hypothetical protein